MCKKTSGLSISLVLLLFASASLAQDPDVEVLPVNVPADLDLSGNVLYAVNFGNNGNPTLGGLVFSQDQAYPQLSFIADAEGETSTWQGVPPNTGYPDLDRLLHGVIWEYSDVDATTSISAGGLSVGVQYELQLIFYTDQRRPMDIVVEGKTILKQHDIYAAQGSVRGKGGSVVKSSFVAADDTLNIRLIAEHDLASLISGFILTALPSGFVDYGSGTTTELFAGGAVWQLKWGQGPWTWCDTVGQPLLDSNVSAVLDLRTTASADISDDLVATLPIGGTLTLSAHDPYNKAVVTGKMVLSGSGLNMIDINASRVIVDEGSGMFLAPFHAPGPRLTMTVNETTGVFAHVEPIGDWEMAFAGSYAIPLIDGQSLQDNIFTALGGNVALIGGLGEFELTGQYAPNASRKPQYFCEYGMAVATSFGAAGGVWKQGWNDNSWPWHECPTTVNAKFLGQNVIGELETTTSGAPSIDQHMTLKSAFGGRLTLTSYKDERLVKVGGRIVGDVAGTFVGDLNAAHASFDASGNILCAFGVAVHDAPDAMITVTEATGVYADIHQAGDWGWYVNGTMTIARVADLSVQENILAALQQPELLLGAREEFVMTGWYYRE